MMPLQYKNSESKLFPLKVGSELANHLKYSLIFVGLLNLVAVLQCYSKPAFFDVNIFLKKILIKF
jgi:hypothetical protein